MSASSIPAPALGGARPLLHPAAGEVLALVGENGAGKTTLVKLLARLYDPDEGRILLDGHDLRDYDLDELRGAMGVIFQDFVRYNLTAADNIAVGRIEARERPRTHRPRRQPRPGRRGHRQAARGYDQMIGKRFRTASSCPAASGRRSPSPAPTCATPRC
jgi:ATP-binding cassette subfamily B protein